MTTSLISETLCSACTHYMVFVEGQVEPVSAEVAWRCATHEAEYKEAKRLEAKTYRYYHPTVGFDEDGIAYIDEGQFL